MIHNIDGFAWDDLKAVWFISKPQFEKKWKVLWFHWLSVEVNKGLQILRLTFASKVWNGQLSVANLPQPVCHGTIPHGVTQWDKCYPLLFLQHHFHFCGNGHLCTFLNNSSQPSDFPENANILKNIFPSLFIWTSLLADFATKVNV